MYLIPKSNLLFEELHLFISKTHLKGGLIDGGGAEGVFSLAKKMASVLHKELQCKVEKLKYGKF